MKFDLQTIIVCLGLQSASASICIGDNASPNWYGSVAYPPYFTRDSPEKCPQKYGLSRCEQSAVMKDGSPNFAKDNTGAEVCQPNVDCYPTKQNCNDTLVCSDLVNLKQELKKGGHNIVCRHEKTYWQQNTGEIMNCHIEGNCLDSEVKPTQRQLQPHGWKSSKTFAKSFHEMGIPIGQTFSSPFSRCAQHAELFSNDPNEERLELLYMSAWKEVLKMNNITDISKPNAIKWQAYNLRNFAGKRPMPGKNNIMVTHGFNIKLALGTAVDEGYCMVLKPDESGPSLAESIGSLTVANQVFTFDKDSFPVNAIARMSPESAVHMQTCDDVRNDSINNQDVDNVLAAYDINHDMKITKDEFISARGSLGNTEDAFDFIQSVFIQPEILGKSREAQSESLSAIELGQFFHLNWGWREFLKTGGSISYPWRVILQNTIGSGGQTSEDRVTAFKQANVILSNLIVVLKDESDYPSKKIMEDKLINCNKSDSESQYLASCAAQVFLTESGGPSYFPVGPGDSGAAALDDESIFGTPLAYPSKWKPSSDLYESRSLKVASCLVTQGALSILEISDLMGCRAPTTNIGVDGEDVASTPKVTKKGRKIFKTGKISKAPYVKKSWKGRDNKLR